MVAIILNGLIIILLIGMTGVILVSAISFIHLFIIRPVFYLLLFAGCYPDLIPTVDKTKGLNHD